MARTFGGRLHSGYFFGMMIHSGLGPVSTWVRQQAHYYAPVEIPTAAAESSAWIAGLITNDQFREQMLLQGVKLDTVLAVAIPWIWQGQQLTVLHDVFPRWKDPWVGVLQDGVWLPEMSTLRDWQRRGYLEGATLDHFLRRHGIVESQVSAVWKAGIYPIPEPPQLLDMSLRRALDPRRLNREDLLAEYDGLYDVWAHAAGAGPVTIPQPGETGKTMSLDFAEVLWALHWMFPTLHQGFEMVRRLRPTGGAEGGVRDPSGQVVLPAMLEAIYKQNKAFPFWRERLRAIAYSVVQIRHLRMMRETDVLDFKGMYELFLDQGYNPRDALNLAQANEKLILDTKTRKSETAAHSGVAQAWQIGAISTQDYLDYLESRGLDEETRNHALELATLLREASKIRRMLTAVRRQFMHGNYSSDTAREMLVTIGLQPDRIDDYLVEWELVLSGDRRLLQGSKIIGYAKQALIPVAEAIARLRHLRYAEEDLPLIQNEILYALSLMQERLAEKLHRKLEHEEAHKKRSIAEARRELAYYRGALSRHGSPAQLKRWLCDGLIDEMDVRERLAFLGWPDDDQTRFLAECLPG